jgi:hypothetical protein
MDMVNQTNVHGVVIHHMLLSGEWEDLLQMQRQGTFRKDVLVQWQNSRSDK